MDFISDQLVNGQEGGGLTLIDVFIKESLAIKVGRGFPAVRMMEVLERLKLERGKPEGIEKPIFKNLWNYWKN